jgi:hypothetical protein
MLTVVESTKRGYLGPYNQFNTTTFVLKYLCQTKKVGGPKCVLGGVNFACFYDFTILIGLWNYSDGVVFLRKKNWVDFFLFYKNNSLFYYAHISVSLVIVKGNTILKQIAHS